MGNVKDGGKKMDPLFPRLHISDADKGGPRTPPRNKMAVSQQFNAPSQTAQRCVSGSVSSVLPVSTNNIGSRLGPTTSSYHDANYKRSMLSSFGHSCGSTRMATRLDSYRSSGINLNISLTTVKQTIETTNCQTLCNTGHPKPQDQFRTTRNNTIVKKLEYEDDYLVPSFTIGNGQHNTNGGSFSTLSTNVYQKQLKLTDKDTTNENKLNNVTSKDIAREFVPCYNSDRDRFSEMLNEDVSTSIRRRIFIDDEQKVLHDSNIKLPLKRKSFQENMAYKDGTKKIWTLLGDNRKINGGNHETLASFNKSEEHGSLHLGDPTKTTDRLETDFLSGFNIAPGEVSQIIGQEQYCIARRTIIQQQRVFQSQLFELHRLIKVQKILAQSPDLLIEDDFYTLKKLPSEDMFPHLDRHKGNNDTEKIYNPNLVDLPPPPPPPIINNGGKQPPWCFLPTPPPGNQWLVPVRSPSEGLVYKPITGPSPPPIGLMTPAYGMSLTPSNADFLTNGYNIPTSYQQGIGVFPSTTLLTSYGFPAITKHICSPAIDDGVNYNKNSKTVCNTESDVQGSSGSSSNERKKDELPLFPTTPMVQDSDQCTEQKQGFDERIKVIKVVPHNPKLASESAARIFQFIQEERKHTE